MKKVGTYIGASAGGVSTDACIARVANTNIALPKTDAGVGDTGTDKTMCYSKKVPTSGVITPVETGYPVAFTTAAKAVITTQKDATTATKWHTAMELNRATDETAVKTAVAAVTPALSAGVQAEQVRNLGEEFMMTWAKLIVDTFDATSDYQKKFYADIKLATTANPLGSEFGTIYAALDSTK